MCLDLVLECRQSFLFQILKGFFLWKERHTPDVTTSVWNRLKMGLTAMEASRQLRWSTGLEIVGVRSSNGSMINMNPGTSDRDTSDGHQTVPWSTWILGHQTQTQTPVMVIKRFHDQHESWDIKHRHRYQWRSSNGFMINMNPGTSDRDTSDGHQTVPWSTWILGHQTETQVTIIKRFHDQHESWDIKHKHQWWSSNSSMINMNPWTSKTYTDTSNTHTHTNSAIHYEFTFMQY